MIGIVDNIFILEIHLFLKSLLCPNKVWQPQTPVVPSSLERPALRSTAIQGLVGLVIQVWPMLGVLLGSIGEVTVFPTWSPSD
jgi:hypothetical protein